MTTPLGPARSHDSLAIRLALWLVAGVAVVLLAVGVLVNVLVTRNVEDLVGAEERARLEFAGGSLLELYREQGRMRPAERLLSRIASRLGAHVRIHGPGGELIAQAGRPLDGSAQVRRHQISLHDGAEPLGSLTVDAPVPDPPQRFLRAFNLSLLVGGAVTVLAILVVAALLSKRLTRPLRDLAEAAGKLGEGDLSARARGGPDRESRELAAAFNDMAERLERSEQLRRRAASDIAHDLATPATVLETQLQAMVDAVVPANRDRLESARASATALSGVVGQLSDLASAESASLQRRPERLELRSVVAEAGRALDALYAERGVHLELDGDGQEVPASADRLQIERAIRNVLANAAQHTRPGGTVRVRAECGGRESEVRVIDEGPGIDRAHLPHLFERFYRADPARTRPGGAGIGLTIARELLAANGGRIGVESTGPGGTTFLIVLPAR